MTRMGKSRSDRSDLDFPIRVIRSIRGFVGFEMQDLSIFKFSIVLLVLVLVGCSAKKKEETKKGEERVVTVDVAPALSSSISLKVTADALLYPLQQAGI